MTTASNRRLPIFILTSLLLTAAIVGGCSSASTERQTERKPATAAIASADPLATAAGMQILEQGGNAFDAAVAVAAALAVVEPAGSGLGGGGFFLLYSAATGEYKFIDAREVAPAASSRDMYLDEQGKPIARASVDGPLAAGIPGEPAGMAWLAENYGTLPLSDLLAPAIKHAEDGFPIGRRALLGLRFRTETILKSPAMTEVFLRGGKAPAEGTIIRQPDLAATLKRFAANGRDGFYSGTTAQMLVDGVQAGGGIWTLDDLANYQVIEREPLITNYQGMRIVTAPLPSSGGIVLDQLFSYLSPYDLGALSEAGQVHALVEAMRRAYRDRAEYLGDSDFVDVPLAKLRDSDYLARQWASFSSERATPSSSLKGIGTDGSEGAQTTHFSVLDAQGNRVAATITVNTWYGSAFMPPGTGVVLNNEMDDFSIKPGVPNDFELIGAEANEVAPGKRPLSSMSPSFLESDRGVAIVGTPGGSRIITMVLRSALLWQQGAAAQDMVELKRFHHQYMPDNISYEPDAISSAAAAELEAMGHELSLARRPFGNMNVVTWDYATGAVEAATDPRGEGEGRVY
jgi:gamma-glutamyltranspeptidase/glutathione hydrolase